MHASHAPVRSSPLPWVLLTIVILVGGAYTFRTQLVTLFHLGPPTTAIDGQGVLKRIQALNNLEAVVYRMEVIVPKNKDGTWWKLGQDEQKALFVADGSVIAGIELGELQVDDVQVAPDGNTITVKLPPAKILHAGVSTIKLHNMDTGLFGLVHLDEALREEAHRDAETRLQQVACESEILEVATENSARDIERLFALLDGVTVTVETQRPDACPTFTQAMP